jgi:microcystin-dependent protein
VANPFLGEIRIVSFNFPPRNWASCNGQLLPISQNQALFALYGTTYGGNGQTTFALPDLRGRVPIHRGQIAQGTQGGEYSHTLTLTELPTHTHIVNGVSNAAGLAASNGHVWGTSGLNPYRATSNSVMASVAFLNAGGSQPHNNMQPYLALQFIVALQGFFPSQT